MPSPLRITVTAGIGAGEVADGLVFNNVKHFRIDTVKEIFTFTDEDNTHHEYDFDGRSGTLGTEGNFDTLVVS